MINDSGVWKKRREALKLKMANAILIFQKKEVDFTSYC